MIDIIDMSVIHLDLSTPISGIITIGATRQTIRLEIIIRDMLLNTERVFLTELLRVDNGTIRL